MKLRFSKTVYLSTLVLLCTFGTGIGADTAPSSPGPVTFTAGASGLHRITFKARIDARAQIVIQDGKMHLDSKGSKPAEEISVNNHKWKAVFSNGISDDFKFGSPLMPFNGKPVTAKLTKSRGSLDIREQPTAQNGQKLVLELQDGAAGPSDFELLITW